MSLASPMHTVWPTMNSHAASNDGSATLSGVRVIVVDDHEDSVELFRIALELCGATAHAFASAILADAWLRAHGGDVVVSDLEVGRGVADLLRTAKALGVPCLVVTGHGTPDRLDAALRAGFDDYRVKPLDPMDLCRAVEKLLERKRQADALP